MDLSTSTVLPFATINRCSSGFVSNVCLVFDWLLFRCFHMIGYIMPLSNVHPLFASYGSLVNSIYYHAF